MSNEFIARKGLISLSDTQLSGSLHVSSSGGSGIDLYVSGSATKPRVGIGIETPAKALTVLGDISASGNIEANGQITASMFTGSYTGDGSALDLGSTAAAINHYQNSGNNRVVTSVDASTVNSEANLTFDGSTLITAGTISASGNIDSDGSITGSAFIGDGSQLTNLASAAIITYTNSTNNRILTSVDSNTVNSEANLTFDGSTLITTGVVSASGNIDSDGSITGSTGVSSSLGEFGSATITAGTITGITDLTVADGGTGASTLTDGGVLLGSGTGAVTAMSVLSDGEVIVGDGSGDPVAESGATLRTSVGVGTGDSPQFTGIELGHASDTTIVRASSGDITIEGNAVYRAGGTDVPVADGGTGASSLTDGGVLLGSGTGAVTAMSVLADSEMIVGDGSTDPVAESGATLRTSIGVGTTDNVQFAEVTGSIISGSQGQFGSATITAGTITGITDLVVADGGTGASTFTDGGVLLGSGTGAVTAMAALGDSEMIVGDGTTDPVAESGATLRTSIGVGTGDSPQLTGIELGHASDTTLVRASSGDVNIEGNIVYRAGGTDVPVADGGTGVSTLTDGGVLLGSGTGAITPMAVLADSEMIVGDGTTDPVAESGATLRTSIGVGTGDTVQVTGIELGHASDTTIVRASSGDITIEGNAVYRAGGTDVPVADGGTGASSLTDGGVLLGSGTGAVTAMSVLGDSEMIVGDGSTDPVAESGATLRTSIGVGTGDSPTFAGTTAGNVNVGVTGDNEIDTSSGNLTIDSAGGTITLDDNVTVSGNLTVSGTTTTINSTVLDIGDRLITLNASSAAGDGGILVNDAETNQTGSLVWDVSADRWMGGISGSEVKLVTLSSSDTLTNKVLTSPDINGGTVDAITSLTVANNVDIGAYDLRAATLTADGLTSGRVPFATTNGQLTDDSDLTFATDTLTVTKIGAFEAAGAINFASQNMTNVDIDSGTITGITDLVVADGGTGVSTFTDGGVLLGSGTGAITAMAVLAQLIL